MPVTSTMKAHRIAVIPGDGIGREVVPEGLRVLQAAASRFGIALQFDEFDWSCDYYLKHGQMMPDDWKRQIGGHDAIFFGAAGWPDKVPDHISLWGSLLKFRREFDQYVNLRPACPARWPTARWARSISTWCAKTPRASIPASAAACSRVPSGKP
jgi:isocitrate/isopropylmalate dehydrogenase